MDPDSRRLRVSVSDGAGRRVRDGGLARWLEAVAPAAARGELAIALVRDARVQALNHAYRRKDRPTDVLAFPNVDRRSANGASPAAGVGLGDIVIATGVARRQALAARHSYASELRVLALHGLLHLLGYDHHRPRDAARMARAEMRLRRRGGLRAGLIERSATAGRAAKSARPAKTRSREPR